jgi:RNA polymerase sigma-70 factor (ECF subfamily)
MAPTGSDWQTWFDPHAPRLLLYARQWLPDRADAEDAVQAGFVKFWRRRPEPCAADLPLLYAAVRSAALDLIKAGSRRRAREARAAADAPAAWWTADSLVERERAAAVQAAVEALPAEQREAVVLRLWGGLTFAEVARDVGGNINTVASRYRMALATLRTRLEEVCRERP